MFEKILVALDGSEYADRALNVALDLAEKYTAEIVLLTVFHPVFIPVGSEWNLSYPQFMEKYLEDLKVCHENVLSEALQKVKLKIPNLKVSKKLEKGRPTDKIIETAKEGNFDIIVMGSRGLGGVRQLLLGSVSDRVADQAPCPVLIVR